MPTDDECDAIGIGMYFSDIMAPKVEIIDWEAEEWKIAMENAIDVYGKRMVVALNGMGWIEGMKNKDVYTLYEGLAEISQDKELKFNIQTSYTLAKNKNFLEPLYGAITETRQKIIKKYASLQENGDLLIPKEKIEDFQKDWDNFMNIDNFVSLQHIKLTDIETDKIDVGTIEKLLNIIDN